jgi:hypothetical protein
MTETIWRKLWLLVLVANDVPHIEAQQAFNVIYGNQDIDLNKDPIFDALILIPNQQTIEDTNVRSNFAGTRFDGLLQQSRTAGVDHLGQDAASATI